MAVSADLIRGHTDTIILRFLYKKDNYAYDINKQVKELSNNTFEFSEATLYSAFKRLEKDGYIDSYWGNENSGARRKYYHITDEGKNLYLKNLKDWEELSQLIERLLK